MKPEFTILSEIFIFYLKIMLYQIRIQFHKAHYNFILSDLKAVDI